MNKKMIRIFIALLFALVLTMSAAYSAYVYIFGIETAAGITLTNNEIRISDLNFISTSSCGYEIFNVSYNKTDININVDLPYLNCMILYEVIIENNTNSHMELRDIIIDSNNDDMSLSFLGIQEGNIILSGESKNIMIAIRYKDNINAIPDNTRYGALIELDYSIYNISGPVAMITFDNVRWTNGSVMASITFNQNVTILNNNGSADYLFTENGSFTFEYEGVNNVRGSVTVNVTWIDKTPPGSVLINASLITSDSITVSVHANDNNLGSGIAAFFYSIDEGNTWTRPTDMKYTFTNLESNTEHIISVKSIDNAGNESEVSSLTIRTR